MLNAMSRRLIGLFAGGVLLAGCHQFSGLFGPRPNPDDCIEIREVAAPMFHVGFVSPASAGATVSLEPWIFLSAPAAWMDEVLPATFKAEVNAEAREIVVSGKVRRKLGTSVPGCAVPAVAVIPEAATLSLPVVLQATGTYTVRIASESFTTNRPPAQSRPDVPPRTYPEAAASRSLVIE